MLLGALQGATEFLPISSSGHLVLVPWLAGWEPPSLAFDAILHLGTATAVIAYFWRDWARMAQGAFRSLRARSLAGPEVRLLMLILLGTLPAAVGGILLEDFFDEMFARPAAAAAFLIGTAGVLTLCEWLSRRQKGLEALSWLDALLIGLGQAAAILPGISRSGMTIASGLARGLERESAARFSFLLATPVILGAGLFEALELAQGGDLVLQAPILIAGLLAANAVGLACIHWLLRYLRRRPLYPFAIYCAFVGAACLIVVWARGA